MSMTLGSRKGVSSEMNVTPLIDVLLVLLIIFMVILPEHHFGEAADIPLPDSSKTVQRPENIVVIRVLDSGQDQRPTLKINEEQVGWDSLEQRLRDIYQLRQDKVAFLQGDPEIDFENVAEVLDISHRAGVERIGLMDEKSRR